MQRRTALAALAVVFARPAAAQTFSPAQIALFETPHLLALPVPTRLDYAFRREEEGAEAVEDRIRLDIRASEEPGRRDVAPEFLTGPRNLAYPPARGFRGNPLLLFALDRDVRELSAATGGATHFFRERIRRALAEAAERRAFALEFEGREVAATEYAIRPFGGEPRARRYGGRRYAFVLSDAVPGAVHTIRSETPAGDGRGAVTETIVFRSATPLPEAAP